MNNSNNNTNNNNNNNSKDYHHKLHDDDDDDDNRRRQRSRSSSSSSLEISFLRSLIKFDLYKSERENEVGIDKKKNNNNNNNSIIIKNHAYVESLRKQLNILRDRHKRRHRQQEDGDDDDFDTIGNDNNNSTFEQLRKFRTYEQKIVEIEKKLKPYEHPAFVSATASYAAFPFLAAASNNKNDVEIEAEELRLQDSISSTTTTTTTTNEKEKKQKNLYKPKKFTISKDGDSSIKREKKMQENLTDEMVDLASRIKRNAEEVSKELSRSNGLVDNMETKLDKNVVAAKNATKRQNAVFRKNKKYGYFSFIVLALVFILFSWVYVVIKFSRDRTIAQKSLDRGEF
jgi:hypothetical protein